LYVPQLQRVEGLLAFIHGHLGQPIASTSVIAPMSRDFTGRLAAKQKGQPKSPYSTRVSSGASEPMT